MHPSVVEYAVPLLQKLCRPKEGWPTAEDFAQLPTWPLCVGPRQVAQCFSEVESLGGEKSNLDMAGSRLLPSCCSSLPVEVVLLCLCRSTGFPDKLVHQVWSTMLCACLHIDMQVELKASLAVTPRIPRIGSKKTPIQQELIHRVFCSVMERMPFLVHNSEAMGDNSCLMEAVLQALSSS